MLTSKDLGAEKWGSNSTYKGVLTTLQKEEYRGKKKKKWGEGFTRVKRTQNGELENISLKGIRVAESRGKGGQTGRAPDGRLQRMSVVGREKGKIEVSRQGSPVAKDKRISEPPAGRGKRSSAKAKKRDQNAKIKTWK